MASADKKKNYPNIIKTFRKKFSVDKCAREIEVMMDCEQFQDLLATGITKK
jgi:hypothetical protein